MSPWSIVLPPKAAESFEGIANGEEVVFEVTGLVERRNEHGSVVIDVRGIEVKPAGNFKEAARRAKVTYTRSLIEPSVG